MASDKVLFSLFFALFVVHGLGERTFDGYSVLRVNPITENQIRFLHELSNYVDNTALEKINFWRRPEALNSTVDLLIAPDIRDDLTEKLRQQNMEPIVTIDNIQR